MNLTHDMEAYILECQEELRQLIRDLSVIPAPSHHEERRAAFCRDWLKANNLAGDPNIKTLPDDVVDKTAALYKECQNRICR